MTRLIYLGMSVVGKEFDLHVIADLLHKHVSISGIVRIIVEYWNLPPFSCGVVICLPTHLSEWEGLIPAPFIFAADDTQSVRDLCKSIASRADQMQKLKLPGSLVLFVVDNRCLVDKRLPIEWANDVTSIAPSIFLRHATPEEIRLSFFHRWKPDIDAIFKRSNCRLAH